MHVKSRFPQILACVLALSSCSTTKVIPQGEYRLVANNVSVEGGCEIPSSVLNSCIKDQPGASLLGWNPLISMYNWSGGQSTGFKGIWYKLGQAPVVLNRANIDASCRNLQRKFEFYGYYGSSVEPVITCKGRKAYVNYRINPGRRYIIDDLRYNIPSSPEFEDDFLADTANVSVLRGDYLRQDILTAESTRSVAHLRRLGYYSLDKSQYGFVADTLQRSGHVLLEYTIKALPSAPLRKYTFGEVGISYPSDMKMRPQVLKGMNLVKPGQTFDERVLENTYSRFSSMKVFSSVAVETSLSDKGDVDCEIVLTPSALQGFKANLEASTNSNGLIGVSPQISFYHKNVFGGGEWFNLGFSGNFQFMMGSDTRAEEFGVSANLSLPRFLGLDYSRFKGANIPRTEFNASYSYQNRPEYYRNIISTSFGYSGRFWNHYYQFYPLQLSYVRLHEVSDAFRIILASNPQLKYAYEDHFDAGAGAYLYYTTAKEVVPKTSYRTTSLRVDVSGNVLNLLGSPSLILGSPYAQYARGEFAHAQAWRFGKRERQAIAARVLVGAGYAYGNSEFLPYEKQFYAGGSMGMRGWQARALGPGDNPMETSFSIPSQTGDMKFEADLEYRIQMFWKLEGAAFAEVGNVWNSSDGYSFAQMASTLAADWGLGLRANFDLILIRVDMGIQLRDPVSARWLRPSAAFSDHRFALHFGVGYPF